MESLFFVVFAILVIVFIGVIIALIVIFEKENNIVWQVIRTIILSAVMWFILIVIYTKVSPYIERFFNNILSNNSINDIKGSTFYSFISFISFAIPFLCLLILSSSVTVIFLTLISKHKNSIISHAKMCSIVSICTVMFCEIMLMLNYRLSFPEDFGNNIFLDFIKVIVFFGTNLAACIIPYKLMFKKKKNNSLPETSPENISLGTVKDDKEDN